MCTLVRYIYQFRYEINLRKSINVINHMKRLKENNCMIITRDKQNKDLILLAYDQKTHIKLGTLM